MKLKNVKCGVRVELKVDRNHLKAGQVGVIVQDNEDVPYIEWDVTIKLIMVYAMLNMDTVGQLKLSTYVKLNRGY